MRVGAETEEVSMQAFELQWMKAWQDAVNQDAKTPQSSPGKQPASFRIGELLGGSVRKHLTRSDKGKIGPAAPIRGRGGVTLESHGRHFGPR